MVEATAMLESWVAVAAAGVGTNQNNMLLCSSLGYGVQFVAYYASALT